MRAAVVRIEDNIVVNLIVADTRIDTAPEGFFLIDADNSKCDIGWTFDPVVIDFVAPITTVEEH